VNSVTQIPSPSPPFNMRSATGAHNHELVSAPDQGAGSSGPPETESLAVGRPLGSIQHHRHYWHMFYNHDLYIFTQSVDRIRLIVYYNVKRSIT
jgi:hypothetical protein